MLKKDAKLYGFNRNIHIFRKLDLNLKILTECK